MKKTLTKVAQILVVVAAVAIIGTVAHAYTNPTAAPTGGNVFAPVNTGNVMQTKNASFGVVGSLFTSISGIFENSTFATKGYFGSDAVAEDLGTSGTAPNLFSALTSVNGKGFIVGTSGGTTISGPLAITSGGPASGAVLTSDASGNATWQPATTTQPPLVSAQTLTPGGVQIKIVRVSSSSDYAYASCEAGSPLTGAGNVYDGGDTVPPGDNSWFLVGGGGDCDDTTSNIKISQPDANDLYKRWMVHCTNRSTQNQLAHATAICEQFTPPAMVSTPSWHPVTFSHGNVGDTCDTWLQRNGFTVANTAPGGANVRVNTSHQGECVYTNGTTGGNDADNSPITGMYPAGTFTDNFGTFTTEIYY